MIQIIAHLGRERTLALAELRAVLQDNFEFLDQVGDSIIFSTSSELNLTAIQRQLGGTIRLGKVFEKLPTGAKAHDLITRLVHDLEVSPVRDFGLSSFGPTFNRRTRDQLGLSIKKELKTTGQATRFVSGTDIILSSVLASKQLIGHGREYLIVPTPSATYLARTETIQDWQAWSARDYNRPVRDARRGMLPPKLARMMLNLAQIPKDESLADLFCGVGTVLQEAALLGYDNLIGFDQDVAAISATESNMAWLQQQRPELTINLQLKAEMLELIDPNGSPFPVGGIVSEADLGSPDLNKLPPRLRTDRFRQLESAYRVWLEKLFALVKKSGVVVLAYPRLLQPNTKLLLPQMAQSIGWEIQPFELGTPGSRLEILNYARADQLIGRDIIRLRKPSS